jgi:hypothetical protein
LYLWKAPRATSAAAACPGTVFQPECWSSALARIQFGINNTVFWVPYSTSRWGNVLSPYWQARGLAHTAGWNFDSYNGVDRDWLQLLPKRAPAGACADPPAFKKACDSCADSWEYAHRCPGAWIHIRQQIQQDTQAALRAWFSNNNKPIPTFGAQDVVIQLRCDVDTLLVHQEFGPAGFSYYKSIPPTATTIIILRDTTVTLPACLRITQALQQHLTRTFPSATVKVQGHDRHSDFAALVFAPYMFRDSQSSFGLWAAAANSGQVRQETALHCEYYNRHVLPHSTQYLCLLPGVVCAAVEGVC